MRIVIDLQGSQTDSRFRGIGRYSLALALGMARNAGDHEIWIVLNAALPAAIADIRRAFDGLVPPERIRVFDPPKPTAEHNPANAWRTRAAERLREYFIEQLRPDAVFVTSLFEGYVDDGVASVGTFTNGSRTAVVLYDLIPLLNPAQYLPAQLQKECYERKIRSLKNAGLLLAISDYSREEGLSALKLPPERVVSVSTAVDPAFKPTHRSPEDTEALRKRYGIARKMVMCAPGGFDARKNIDGLILAYGMLPRDLRSTCQLVIASKIGDAERNKLVQARKRAGLGDDELVMTGYVQDDDLRALYTIADLFVFPSKHEGFGLPALEAMACGAPVIGSNTTSVPEVIGREEAMFDPSSPKLIAQKIEEVLRDEDLQQRLRKEGLGQAKKFSWDVSAQRALRAIEAHIRGVEERERKEAGSAASLRRKLAFVSPLPPLKTGIADYSADLLPALMQHFDVELVTDQEEIVLPATAHGLPRRAVAWFTANASHYDRIVYQFGNSPFHTHMFGLLKDHPGVVVLHDFFLSGVLAYEERYGGKPGMWTDALLQSHGYQAVLERHTAETMEQALNTYPCNLDVLQDACGVIVHSGYSLELARRWYGPEAGADWKVIPLVRTPAQQADRVTARVALGIPQDAFVVCSFGFVDATKFSDRLVEAWLVSKLAADPSCHLMFVGENHGGEYGKQIAERIRSTSDRIRITGWTDAAVYAQYLQAADIGVQLRSISRGETSAAVLDCMNYGLATIVNAMGSMADLPADAVWKLPETFNDEELVAALETLWQDKGRREALGMAARERIHTRHAPQACAVQYVEAIEEAYRHADTGLPALLQSLAAIPELPQDDEQALQQLAQSVANSHARKPALRQLLVDVSGISRNDLKTGIERVVRAQLVELIRRPPAGFRVEPVYLSREGGTLHYRYARSYAKKLLGIDTDRLDDLPVDIGMGDVFYCPDYHPDGNIAAAHNGIYASWRARGVQVHFLIHDILPVLRPEFFPPNADKLHGEWLECIAQQADGIVCISHAVAGEAKEWLAQRGIRQLPRFSAVHHGADITASAPSQGLPDKAMQTLAQIARRPSFLMVGTIEPRKGHLQAIQAFERLWSDDVDANLVIVGKEGWTALPEHDRRTIPEIIRRLRSNSELGKRLLWLEGISDEFLEGVYGAAACLLYPSEGEGFGLPLIEAAQHKLPVIARDLPVFREVAGEHALYFSGLDADNLADAVRSWLDLQAQGKRPTSAGMRWRTWRENAAELGQVLCGKPEAAPGCIK